MSEPSVDPVAPQERAEESKGLEKRSQTAMDSLRCCLFCNKASNGIKKCLDHMRIKHSFFVLDIDCLISIKSLLSYLAEKVHLGNMCIMCNKGFSDYHAAQHHMIDKGHCFMNVDDFDIEYAGRFLSLC